MDDSRDRGVFGSRRAFVAGAAVVIAGAGASAFGWWRRRTRPSNPTPPAVVRRLLGDAAPGDAVQRWTIAAVHDVHWGAVPVVLTAADGRRFQVDIMARDPKDALLGVANTERFSLFVVNGGSGETPTDEEQGLGAMALATIVRDDVEIPGLLSLPQRMDRHRGGNFAVPLG